MTMPLHLGLNAVGSSSTGQTANEASISLPAQRNTMYLRLLFCQSLQIFPRRGQLAMVNIVGVQDCQPVTF